MGSTWTRNWPREFARDQVLKSFQIDSFDGKPYEASKTSTSYSTTSSNPFGHVSVNLNDGQKQQNKFEHGSITIAKVSTSRMQKPMLVIRSLMMTMMMMMVKEKKKKGKMMMMMTMTTTRPSLEKIEMAGHGTIAMMTAMGQGVVKTKAESRVVMLRALRCERSLDIAQWHRKEKPDELT